jgi:hypothetical protein
MSYLIVNLDHKYFMAESSYIIFKESDTFYALNTRTKAIREGRDASAVIQEALNSLGS